MKNWLNKNYKILIILAFLIPIIIVAVVSISHVTVWYGISNPMSWAMYLSLGVEIAALSALAAISASMGRNVYFPFIIVTIIQFIGNIFFSYQYIDITSKVFKDWVDLVSPLISSLGVEEGDLVGHRRFLALFSGGLLPLISLSFLHMLVKFSEDARLNKQNVINDEKILENNITPNVVTASDIIGEVSKVRLSEEDLKILEEHLLNSKKPNENIKEASSVYEKNTTDKNTINDEIYDFENEEGYNDSELDEYYDLLDNNLTENELVDVVEEKIVEDDIKNIESIENESVITEEPIQVIYGESITTPIAISEDIKTEIQNTEQEIVNNVVNFEIFTPINQDVVEKKN